MRPIRVFIAPCVEDRPQANVARLQAIPRFEKKRPWHSLIRLTGGFKVSILPGQIGQTVAKEYKQHRFSTLDIARAVGKSVGAVRKDRQRGKFDPKDLSSLAEYVSNHAPDPAFVQLIDANLDKPPKNTL